MLIFTALTTKNGLRSEALKGWGWCLGSEPTLQIALLPSSKRHCLSSSWSIDSSYGVRIPGDGYFPHVHIYRGKEILNNFTTPWYFCPPLFRVFPDWNPADPGSTLQPKGASPACSISEELFFSNNIEHRNRKWETKHGGTEKNVRQTNKDRHSHTLKQDGTRSSHIKLSVSVYMLRLHKLLDADRPSMRPGPPVCRVFHYSEPRGVLGQVKYYPSHSSVFCN